MTDGTRVEWREWDEAAFDEARRRGAEGAVFLARVISQKPGS